jgi:hypothetical protein
MPMNRLFVPPSDRATHERDIPDPAGDRLVGAADGEGEAADAAELGQSPVRCGEDNPLFREPEPREEPGSSEQ